MRAKLGLVTVGQSERTDFLLPMQKVWGDHVEVSLKGALDFLGPDDLAALAPHDDEYPIVTRLADGSSAVVAKKALVPRVNACFRHLFSEGVTVAALMCTGTFVGLEAPSGMTILYGCEIINNCTKAALPPPHTLGVLVPLATQQDLNKAKFEQLGYTVRIAHASPYDPLECTLEACRAFADAEMIILHCMGFSEEHRQCIRKATGKPVLQANRLIAHMAMEVLGV